MKQKWIVAVICKRFKKIDACFHKIGGSFEMESIHEFRTGVKKLRAFMRLLSAETGKESKLKIPKKMKAFYGYAGTVRNLQLQLKNIEASNGNIQQAATEAYVDYLKKMTEKWKENIIELMEQRKNFRVDQKKIVKQLPVKLTRAGIKRFVHLKLNELPEFINALPGDDALHSIRKLLKDLLYNWPYLKRYKKLLPPGLSKREKIKSFTELIGLFLDKSVAIFLLETYCKDLEENGLFIENEIRELQSLKGEYETQKAALARIIYLNPALLQLSPVNNL